MSSFEHAIVIQRPPEEVFAFIHDFEGIARWQPHVIESKQSSTPPQVGTELHQVRQFFGRRIQSVFEITEYDPPKTSSFTCTSRPVPMDGTYVLEAVERGTELTWRCEMHGSGFMRLAEPLFARLAQDELDTSFRHLKELLEAEA